MFYIFMILFNIIHCKVHAYWYTAMIGHGAFFYPQAEPAKSFALWNTNKIDSEIGRNHNIKASKDKQNGNKARPTTLIFYTRERVQYSLNYFNWF